MDVWPKYEFLYLFSRDKLAKEEAQHMKKLMAMSRENIPAIFGIVTEHNPFWKAHGENWGQEGWYLLLVRRPWLLCVWGTSYKNKQDTKIIFLSDSDRTNGIWFLKITGLHPSIKIEYIGMGWEYQLLSTWSWAPSISELLKWGAFR